MNAQSKLKSTKLDLKEINRKNLSNLRIRMARLKISSEQFVKDGYYSSSESNKTDMTFDEVNIEMDYLDKKEKMLVKMVGE